MKKYNQPIIKNIEEIKELEMYNLPYFFKTATFEEVNMNIDEILTFINNFESNTKQELFFQKKLNYYFNILFYINNNNHNQDNEEIEQELENKGIIYDGCYIEGSSLYNIMKHIIQLVRILSNHKKLVITYKNFN